MKKILLTFLTVFFASHGYTQITLKNADGFIGYIFSQNGNLIYQPDTPSSDFYLNRDFGISYTTIGRENSNTVSLGFQIKPGLFFVGNFGVSSDDYSFKPRGGSETQKSKISVTTFAPYIAIRKYVELREKIFPYIELGYSRRFTSAETSNYYDTELRADFESSIEEILSPTRWNVEAGLDYNFYEFLSAGFSTALYYESRKGKALDDSNNGKSFYDFEQTRIGQVFNFKLTIHY